METPDLGSAYLDLCARLLQSVTTLYLRDDVIDADYGEVRSSTRDYSEAFRNIVRAAILADETRRGVVRSDVVLSMLCSCGVRFEIGPWLPFGQCPTCLTWATRYECLKDRCEQRNKYRAPLMGIQLCTCGKSYGYTVGQKRLWCSTCGTHLVVGDQSCK